MSRPLGCPWCSPLRGILMNDSSLHSPIPVSLSGVRLIAKLTPQGPAHAVSISLVVAATFLFISSANHDDGGSFSG